MAQCTQYRVIIKRRTKRSHQMLGTTRSFAILTAAGQHIQKHVLDQEQYVNPYRNVCYNDPSETRTNKTGGPILWWHGLIIRRPLHPPTDPTGPMLQKLPPKICSKHRRSSALPPLHQSPSAQLRLRFELRPWHEPLPTPPHG